MSNESQPESAAAQQPKLARYRFSIRDVLWLTFVVGLVLAWLVQSRQVLIQRQDLEIAEQKRRALTIELVSTQQQVAAERISGLQAEKDKLQAEREDLEKEIGKLTFELEMVKQYVEHGFRAKVELEAEARARAAAAKAPIKDP